MHELGVVFYVVKDVKKVAEENHVEKVSSVTLEIGEVSGILHDYLTDCWNWAKKKEPLMEEAELKIEQIEAVTFCEECQKEYPTAEADPMPDMFVNQSWQQVMGKSVRTVEVKIPICFVGMNF